MNILVAPLPVSVTIDGREYEIDTDFRSALLTIMAFEDGGLTTHEKAMIMLANLYPTIPDNVQAAFERAQWFLNGGEEREETGKPRVYSFTKDARYIFAAFRQTHGIDLQTANLHWWEFLALFMDLGQDTTFCQLTALRSRIKSGKATKEERAAARAMGEAFDVPEVDTRTLEEKEIQERFFRAIEEGKRRQALNG